MLRFGRQALDGIPVEQNASERRAFEAAEHHQRRRLAGPGWAQHGQEFTPANLQIQILHDEIDAVIGFPDAFKAHQGVVLVARR
jgi:hypothetical protein